MGPSFTTAHITNLEVVLGQISHRYLLLFISMRAEAAQSFFTAENHSCSAAAFIGRFLWTRIDPEVVLDSNGSAHESVVFKLQCDEDNIFTMHGSKLRNGLCPTMVVPPNNDTSLILILIVSLKLRSFCTVLHNARVRYCAQSSLSCNGIVVHLNAFGAF